MKTLFRILLIALIFTGCNNRRPGETGSGKGPKTSATQASISENIDKLASNPWNRADYDEILNNQIIPSNVLSKGQKEGLRSKLAMYYSRSIVNDMKKNLTDNCEKSHGRLAAAAKELKQFSMAEDADDVLRRYEAHQAEMAFAASIGSRQQVRSWRDEYDEAHERNINAKIAAHRDQKPTCAYLQRAFSAEGVNRAFTNRRNNYALDVASRYSERKEPWTLADERKVKILILSAVNDMPAEAQRKIEKYKEDHQPVDNI